MNYRQRPDMPSAFAKLPLRQNQQQDINNWLNLPIDERGQKPNLPPRLEQIPQIMALLYQIFHGKCAYCETPLTKKDARLAFFRPLEKACQPESNDYAINHYFWLLWDWTNLHLACRTCRDNKGLKFPIWAEKRATVGVYGAERLKFVERPMLLDPCLDNPALHLEFKENGSVRDKTKRGEVTIAMLDLNRKSLCAARKADIQALQQVVNKGCDPIIVEELSFLCQDDQPFVGIRRQLLRRWLQIKHSSPDTSPEVKAALNEPVWKEFIDQLENWLQLPSLAVDLLEAYVHILTYPDANRAVTRTGRIAELTTTYGIRESVRAELAGLRQEVGLDINVMQWEMVTDSVRHVVSAVQSQECLDDMFGWLDSRKLPTGILPIRNRWALLVGINGYDDPTFAQLRYCINDVLALQKLLERLGYTVVVLHDDMEQKHLIPTRNNILAELTKLCQVVEEADLLYIHFAGHGTQEKGQPLLITSDTREPMLEQSGLRLTELEQQMRRSAARRLILTLDACHVGIEIGRSRSDYELFIRNVYELAEGFALIAGSTAQQVACEWHEKQHGVFTYFLLEGLSGAAMNNRELVTVDSLKDFTLSELRRWNIQHSGILQEPTARVEGIGDIILGDYRNINHRLENGSNPANVI